jgi:hypothetical protein
MIINKILIIIIIIILLFLHNNKKKYIEKFSLTDNIKTVINNIYNKEYEPIISLSNFLNGISKSNDLQIYSNLNVNNVYSKKDIKNNNISLNTMKSNSDNYINYLYNTYEDIRNDVLSMSELYKSTNATNLMSKDYLVYQIQTYNNQEYKLTVNPRTNNLPLISKDSIWTLGPAWPSILNKPYVYKWLIMKW